MPPETAAAPAAPPPSTPAVPAAPATPPAAPATPETPAFSWDTVGLAPEHGALVKERQWGHVNDVLTSYRNLEKLTGAPPEQIIRIPKGDDEAGHRAMYARLGMPEKVDGYNLPVPEGDKGEFAKTAAQWFHQAGLSVKQATAIATAWNTHVQTLTKAETERQTAEDTKQVNALKQEWGAEFQSRSELVDRAASTFGLSKAEVDAFKVVLGPKKAMEVLHAIGSKIATEDKTLVGGDTPPNFKLSPTDAKAEIERLKKDRAFQEQFNSGNPQIREEARVRMEKLHKIAFPSQP